MIAKHAVVSSEQANNFYTTGFFTHLWKIRLGVKYLINKFRVVFFLLWISNPSFLFAQHNPDSTIEELKMEVEEMGDKDRLSLHFIHPWKYKIGDDTLWKAGNFDDGDWKQLSSSTGTVNFIRDTALNNALGIIWFRSEFEADSALINKPLGFYFEQIGSAAEVYVDGNLLASFGKVGNDIISEESQYALNPKPHAFIITQAGKHSVAVRFSFFHNSEMRGQGSDTYPHFTMYVKNLNEVIDEFSNSSRFFPIIFLFAIFFTLGVVHSILFFYFKSDRVNLYFGTYCISIAFVLFYEYYVAANSDYEVFNSLDRMAGYIAPLMVIPLVALYHTIYYKRLLRFFWILLILYLLRVGFGLFDFKISGLFSVIIFIGSLIEIFRVNIRAFIKKRDGAYILGLGILIFPFSIVILLAVAAFYRGEIKDNMADFLIIYPVVLGIPISITVFQARNFARVNKALSRHVEEIKELSEKTIEHEKEKKKILEVQNSQLESMVTERTMELKQRQQQLIHSEKMASVGILTAGVAHEINNPINFVSANITPLKRDIEEIMALIDKYSSLDQSNYLAKLPEILKFRKEIDVDYITNEIKSLINGIEQGSKRTAEIVKGLRNFSRLDEEEMKLANVNDSIESTLLLLQNKLKHQSIEVVKSLGSIPEINCYPGPLNQVFMNVLSNAIDAIEVNTPADVVSTSAERKIYVTTSLENSSVRISIRDTGTGISDEVKKRLFDPFFTTKDVGKGTGLGLSISYGIIEKHHGKIEVKSTPGKGTEFIITLPVNS